MGEVRLFPLADDEKSVTTRIILVDNGPPIPCVTVRYEADHPSLGDTFARFKGIQLDIINADRGGYHFSVVSDRRILEISEDEYTKSLQGKNQKVELVKKILREGAAEFSSTHLATEKEGRQFINYLRESSGEWVLAVVASDAILVFVNEKGSITGRMAISREAFLVEISP